ncbi:hypothetical protein [Streptomyces pratensis]|uniref:hypothetical protein n=1 Tax=Streptomyces pratensis TaxID=1169025 RepID=UPI003644B531
MNKAADGKDDRGADPCAQAVSGFVMPCGANCAHPGVAEGFDNSLLNQPSSFKWPQPAPFKSPAGREPVVSAPGSLAAILDEPPPTDAEEAGLEETRVGQEISSASARTIASSTRPPAGLG